MLSIKPFWVLFTPTLVAIHGCMSPNLKARSWMVRRSSILFNRQLKHQQEPNDTKTYKRARSLESSDQDEGQHQDPKPKKPKVANSELTLLPAPSLLLNQASKPTQLLSTISDETINPIKRPIEKNIFLYENQIEFAKKRKTLLNNEVQNDTDLPNPQNNATKELFNRLPKTPFFKSFISKINNRSSANRIERITDTMRLRSDHVKASTNYASN